MKIISGLSFLLVTLSVCLPVASAASFSSSDSHRQDDSWNIRVVTSILPLQFFVDRIGKERVESSVMVPPGGNPHSYEPSPGQMVELGQADLFVKAGSGVEFELEWMERFTELYPSLAVCNSSEGIRLRHMGAYNDGHHHHGHLDPHVWLSPANAVMIASNIADAFIRLDPDGAAFYRKNLDTLTEELNGLSAWIRQQLQRVKHRSFLVFHPAWGYFAEEFGLRQIAAEAEGKELTPSSLVNVIGLARESDIRVIFVSPQFSQAQASAIAAEIDGVTEVVDPLSVAYIDNLRQATRAFATSMQ